MDARNMDFLSQYVIASQAKLVTGNSKTKAILPDFTSTLGQSVN